MFPACLRSAIEPGEGLRIDGPETQGVPIAVFHTDDGEFLAVDDTCTHQDASLADGWLEGCEIECPLHASRFDLRTGAVDAPPAKLAIRTHVVTVDDDTVYVTLSSQSPNLPPGVMATVVPAEVPSDLEVVVVDEVPFDDGGAEGPQTDADDPATGTVSSPPTRQTEGEPA